MLNEKAKAWLKAHKFEKSAKDVRLLGENKLEFYTKSKNNDKQIDYHTIDLKRGDWVINTVWLSDYKKGEKFLAAEV